MRPGAKAQEARKHMPPPCRAGGGGHMSSWVGPAASSMENERGSADPRTGYGRHADYLLAMQQEGLAVAREVEAARGAAGKERTTARGRGGGSAAGAKARARTEMHEDTAHMEYTAQTGQTRQIGQTGQIGQAGQIAQSGHTDEAAQTEQQHNIYDIPPPPPPQTYAHPEQDAQTHAVLLKHLAITQLPGPLQQLGHTMQACGEYIDSIKRQLPALFVQRDAAMSPEQLAAILLRLCMVCMWAEPAFGRLGDIPSFAYKLLTDFMAKYNTGSAGSYHIHGDAQLSLLMDFFMRKTYELSVRGSDVHAMLDLQQMYEASFAAQQVPAHLNIWKDEKLAFLNALHGTQCQMVASCHVFLCQMQVRQKQLCEQWMQECDQKLSALHLDVQKCFNIPYQANAEGSANAGVNDANGLQNANAQLQSVRQEVEENQLAISQQKQQLRELTDATTAQQQALNDLMEQARTAAADLAAAQQQLAAATQELASKEQQVIDKQHELAEASAEVQSMEASKRGASKKQKMDPNVAKHLNNMREQLLKEEMELPR